LNIKSPLSNSAPFATEGNSFNAYSKNLSSPTYARQQDASPYGSSAGARSDNHNPITNPIPGNLQNPYISREYNRGGFANSGSRNVFTGVANNLLV